MSKLKFECDLPDEALWALSTDGRLMIGVFMKQNAVVLTPDQGRYSVKFKITAEEGDVKWQSGDG